MMSLLQAQARYGEIHNATWGGAAEHASLWLMPESMKPELAHWLNSATGEALTHVYALTDMHEPLEAALASIIRQNLAPELRTFDGCFNIRPIRGEPLMISAHAYAGALDINAATNLLGTPGDISEALASCFILQGFTWGKSFRRCDPMHFSWLGF